MTNFAIKGLMNISSPREDGGDDPLMHTDFCVPGTNAKTTEDDGDEIWGVGPTKYAVASLMEISIPRDELGSTEPLLNANFDVAGPTTKSREVTGEVCYEFGATKFAINSLMEIDWPRYFGNHTAPLMRRDFVIPGVMHIRSPFAEGGDATESVTSTVGVAGLLLSFDGCLITLPDLN